MHDLTNDMTESSSSNTSPFSFSYQSPVRQIEDSSPGNPLFFSYRSPAYDMIKFFGNSSPMTSPISDVTARKGKGTFPTKDIVKRSLKRPATEWHEDTPGKRHQVIDLRDDDEDVTEAQTVHRDEQGIGYALEQTNITTFAEEDVDQAEVAQEDDAKAARSDLLVSVDALVETLCDMRNQIDELQNERDESLRALQAAQEELDTYKETMRRVVTALGYES